MKETAVGFFALLLTLLTCSKAFGQVSGYTYSKRARINSSQIPGNLNNFPVLFKKTADVFKSAANGGLVQNQNGYDILFTDANDNPLDFQLESYNPTTGEVVAWVNVPSLSSSADTNIKVYFGNPNINSDQSTTATWDGNFAMVQHLSNSFLDGTGNNNDGTNNGSSDIAGQIARARDFNGSNDYIEVNNSNTISPFQITLSFWVYVDDYSNSPDLVTKGNYQEAYSSYLNSSGQAVFSVYSGFTFFGGTPQNYLVNSNNPLNTGQWYYLTFTKSGFFGGVAQLYVNGNLNNAVNTSGYINYNNEPLYISAPSTTNFSPFNGRIDEIHLSNTIRSDSWIKTEYSNQSNPDAFLTLLNDPPVLANIETSNQSYKTGASPAEITSTITVSDIDGNTINSASIGITNNYLASEDSLGFTTQNGISGSWNKTTGRLSLTGPATLNEYQTALRSVTYVNTNTTNPSTADRTVSFTVSDPNSSSNTVSRDIGIVPPNQPPVLSNIESDTLDYTEGDGQVPVTSNITISDSDNANLESATITISGNYVQGEDKLAFTDANGITGSWDSANGKLTLTGTSSKANYQTALRSVTYNDVSPIPNTNVRTVTFSVNDGEDPSNSQSHDLSVTPTNNKPVLSNIESDALEAEGDNPPQKISTSLEVDDADDANIQSATIQVTNNYVSSEDVLGYSDILGISGSWDSSTGTLTLTGSASKSSYQTALRTITYDNTTSTPSPQTRTVSFTINDGTDDSAPVSRDIALSVVKSISGLELWLKGDAGVSVNGSNQVTGWADQSGNSHDFSPGSLMPTYANNIAGLNNQSAISFSGTGDFMQDADGANYINGNTQFTLFEVIKSSATGTDHGFFDTEDPNSTDDILTIRYDQGGANGGAQNLIKTGILSNDPSHQLESFSDIQTTDGQILSLDWKSGDQFNLVVDGVLNNPSAVQTPPSGTINNATKVVVGKGAKDQGTGSSWNGYIAEVILFNRFLSLSERQSVEDYLSNKYNINIRLIGKATGGKNISADTYASGTYTSLTGPRLREDYRGQLNQGKTIVFEAPDGFEWDTGGTAPSVDYHAAYGDNPGDTNLKASFTSRTTDKITFTIDQESNSTSKPGELSFSNFRIRPSRGTLPNEGTITNSGTTGPGGTTNYGDIIMVPGQADSLVYEQQPTNNTVNQTISPAPVVQIADQFGNAVAQQNTAITAQLSSGTGNLSGTTTQISNIDGTTYFNDLGIDQTGTKKITVSASGLTSSESNSFEIKNPNVLSRFKVEKVSGGIIPPQIAGVSFDIKITALNGNGNVFTNFNGTVDISSGGMIEDGAGTTANFTNGVLSSQSITFASTGEFTITATNSNGPENGESNSFKVNPGPADNTKSTISANPTFIQTGGATSTITVQLKDSQGNNVQTGGDNVTLTTNAGTLTSVTDNGDGTYTATLTSSSSNTVATVTGTLNSETIDDNARVTFSQFDAVWVGTLGGDPPAEQWSNPDNWQSGSVPGPTDAVFVPKDPQVGTRYPVVQNADQTVSTLVIEDGADVTIAGTRTLTVTGDLTGGGEVNGSNSSTLAVGGNISIGKIRLGNVILNGTSLQQLNDNRQFMNLEIDNSNNVLASDNILVTGTLTLTAGNLIIPSGKNIIINNQSVSSGALTFRRALTGVKGWRMITSPVSSTYGDLFDGMLTQGYAGSQMGLTDTNGDSLQPNVLWYKEDYQGTDNQRYRAPTSASQSLTEGRGLFVYVFGDVSGDARYNEKLPDTLEVSGPEFTGNGSEVNFNVTYTDIADSIDVPDTGWNLVGNPYGATLNWDNNATWTKTNINQTIYIWDPNANAGNGNFLSWNGTTGSLGSGLIAPFQGFWVKANASNPVLKVTKENQTINGIFRRKEQKSDFTPKLELKLEGKGIRGIQQEAFLMFSNEASRGADPKDGYRMLPFGQNFFELYFERDDGTQMAIENLPKNFKYRYELPLSVGGVIDGKEFDGTATLSWPKMEKLPGDWIITLTDNKTGKTINLREQSFYSFELKGSESKKKSSAKAKRLTTSSYNGTPDDPIYLLSTTRDKARGRMNSIDKTRFTLTVTTQEIEANIPKKFRLSQNYPNPFNPSTKIEFGLPEKSHVTIEIYDILGRLVARLADHQVYPAGFHTIPWTPGHLASGIYLYRVRTDDQSITRKMTYIK